MTGGAAGVEEFEFAFEPAYRQAGRLIGIRPDTTLVTLDADALAIRFGPWRLRTARANVASAELGGPYSLLKTIGPAHFSLSDRGVTFATNRRRGVCIVLYEPVPALDLTGLLPLRHPNVTVTVADPDRLVDRLSRPA